METLREIITLARLRSGLSQGAFGERHGIGQQTISNLENGKSAWSHDIARIAAAVDLSTDEVETLMAHAAIESGKLKRLPGGVRDKVEQIIGSGYKNSDIAQLKGESTPGQSAITARITPPMGNRDVPVYGRAQGGPDGMFEFNGEIIGWETRPPTLDGVRDAYAVYVDGESMYPRYKVGETVWVNPMRPPARGDDVIVQLYPANEGDAPYGFIKEFRARTPTRLVVWQHNPPREVEYPIESVKSVHYIAYSQR